MKAYFSSLLLRFVGLAALVFLLIGLVPGDSRSYLGGAFESSGLDLGARNINPWTMEYMSFHFGSDWASEVFFAFLRSFSIASLSALFSLVFFLALFAIITHKNRDALDLFSGFLLSLVSVLLAPVLAIVYLRYFDSGDESLVTYAFAALSISFVAIGSYLKFLVSKFSQVEYRELEFGFRARGIESTRFKWVHAAKLLSPDFLVLFLSRYAAYIAGVFVAELVFNVRGLGWYFSQAFQSRSGLMLTILVLVASLFYLLLNHLAIYLASFVDPRRNREF